VIAAGTDFVSPASRLRPGGGQWSMADLTPVSTTPYGRQPPAYRLPEATRPGPVHLQVADLARSTAFYEEILGLRAIAHGPGTAALAAATGAPLIWLHEKAGVQRAPRAGRFGLFHVAVLLPDRASLGRFLTAAHGRVPIASADHWVSEALYLTDPDGLGLEVYADRPRAEWRRRGAELAMATEALDLQDVARAGGGVPWSAAPAGTTIGHVHLHVGDLQDAARFYHAGLGLDATVWSYPGALFLAAGGYHHHLGTNTWSAGPAAGDDEARLLEWQLVLPSPADTTQAADSLARSGFETTADGGSWITADPWGTRLRLDTA
jgi:catechol 2,3-dioxygenase